MNPSPRVVGAISRFREQPIPSTFTYGLTPWVSTFDAGRRIAEADAYLKARTGRYEWRCVRYDAALESMHAHGLSDDDTVVDVGAGMGEFGARLHTGCGPILVADDGYYGEIKPSRARYVPVDAAIDGTDLEDWRPPGRAEWFVALELLEHLERPHRLMSQLVLNADKGVIVSTPNPSRTDVLGMDATHKTPITRAALEMAGFTVTEASFCGKPADSLFGVYTA